MRTSTPLLTPQSPSPTRPLQTRTSPPSLELADSSLTEGQVTTITASLGAATDGSDLTLTLAITPPSSPSPMAPPSAPPPTPPRTTSIPPLISPKLSPSLASPVVALRTSTPLLTPQSPSPTTLQTRTSPPSRTTARLRLPLTEGQVTTITASLGAATDGSDLTLTLSDNSTVITVADGSSFGTASYTATDNVYTSADITETLSITGFSGGGFEDLATAADDTVTISDDFDVTTVSDTELADSSLTEGQVTTITASLECRHHGLRSHPHTLDNSTVITVADGSSFGTASYTATDNVYTSADITETLSITGFSGGGFEDLNTAADASVTISDDSPDEDVTTVSLELARLPLTEGQVTTITASLERHRRLRSHPHTQR